MTRHRTDAIRAAQAGIAGLEELTADAPRARRNLLVGLWAAERMGLAGADAVLYALTVIESDHRCQGDADVLARLSADLAAAGCSLEEEALRAELAAAQRLAYAQTLPHNL
jgi:hypothetical protein